MAIPCDMPTAKAHDFRFSISLLSFLFVVGFLLVFTVLFLKRTILLGIKEHLLVALSGISLMTTNETHLLLFTVYCLLFTVYWPLANL